MSHKTERSTSERVALVVPCFNEASRINMQAFKNAPKNIVLCFVDDGSNDETWSLLEPMQKLGHAALKLSANQGKSGAVQSGILHVLKDPLFNDIKWVGFWDADLAAPLDQVNYLLAYNDLAGGSYDAVVGSRVDRKGSDIVRSFKRHFLGRTFATAADLMFGIGAYDTQCGSKLFRRDIAAKVFSDSFTSRWIFDVELFLRLENNRILEAPLEVWRDVEGSKVKVLKVAFRVISDLLKIKSRYKK